MEIDGVEQIPEAVDVGAVAGMRAGSELERAGDDEDPASEREHEPEEPEPPRRRLHPAVRAAQASTATMLAVASTTSASRKWVATISGCRSSRIVEQTERRLRDRAEEGEAGEPLHPAADAGRAVRVDPGSQQTRSGRGP